MSLDAKKIEQWRALAAAAAGLILTVKDKGGHPAGAGLILEFETARMEALRDLCRDGFPALLSERKEMLDLMREIEWAGRAEAVVEIVCLLCGGAQPEAYDHVVLIGKQQDTERWREHFARELAQTVRGHAPDCRLAAFLK